jgi:alpha-amylase
MYARMLAISEEVGKLPARKGGKARRELYRAQCNCAWWHGVFGGVYMPHLRGAVWQHLLAAERLAREAGASEVPALQRGDFDLDGQEELRLSSTRLSALISPRRGGHLFELDWSGGDFNLTDVLTRRFEAYHLEIRERLDRGAADGETDRSVSIHDLQRQALPEHGDHLVYDRAPLESLVDHLVPGDWKVEDLWRGQLPSEIAFRKGEYRTARSGRPGRVKLRRASQVGGRGPVELCKTVEVRNGGLHVDYRLHNRGPEPVSFTFGVEFNLGADFALPGGGQARGAEVRFFPDGSGLSLICAPRGLVARLLAAGSAAACWAVKTVSQSETGYEICVQGTGALVWWYLEIDPQAGAQKSLALSVEPA